ncbi:hypothetical protein DFR52_102866 [Hoeflea marina]|uniref:Uncharacterized protein n=1 Tax=Hoeflea marina TaxID=274592 RepID=A0A317PQH0_9HYPH|nr:hypothetical protein [Hoeflea marina]PWW02198.1 hypothetical protein DFR52_102866 [Hoeflea marina]
MTNIIPFVPAPGRKAPRGGATEMTATVLFFTGVRYERRPEPAAAPEVRMLAGPPRQLAVTHKPGNAAGTGIPFHDDTSPMGRGHRR